MCPQGVSGDSGVPSSPGADGDRMHGVGTGLRQPWMHAPDRILLCGPSGLCRDTHPGRVTGSCSPLTAVSCRASWLCVQQMSAPNLPLPPRPPAPGAHQPSGVGHISGDDAQPWPQAAPGHQQPSRGLQGQMLLPKAGVTKLLPDSAVTRTRGAGCGLFSLFSLYSSCNASSPFGCMRGTRGTQPCSVYRGGRDTPSGRGSVQMCHHSWKQNTQCLQKLRPECTVALPAHGPSRPGLTGLPPWSPWQWDVPRLSPRFLTVSQVGVSPTACTGRKVFHLLSPTPPYPAR